jgi:hypothetical protein
MALPNLMCDILDVDDPMIMRRDRRYDLVKITGYICD